MAEQTPPNRPYTPLPDELKPHYRSRSDFWLMSRAYRLGWVRDVPAERQAEWDQDLVKALPLKILRLPNSRPFVPFWPPTVMN